MTGNPPTLLVPLRNRAQLFELYYFREGSDGLFVPGELAFDVGEQVSLELSFLEEQRAFRIRGAVRWRRLRTGRPALLPGIGVEFDSTERKTRDLILDFARGREIEFKLRSAHRFPVTLKISYASDSRFLTDVADDLSLGGLFIATDNILPIGSELNLKLKPPGYLMGVKLHGIVVWTAEDSPRRGMGIKFVFENERKRKQVETVIEELKAAIIRDMRIQVPR